MVEHRVTEKLAKAKPRPMAPTTLSPISVPVRERNWTDINPERFRQDCFKGVKSHRQITATLSINPLRKMMEQYDLAILWKSSRQSSMVLRTGQLTIGSLVWLREEDQRKCSNIA